MSFYIKNLRDSFLLISVYELIQGEIQGNSRTDQRDKRKQQYMRIFHKRFLINGFINGSVPAGVFLK